MGEQLDQSLEWEREIRWLQASPQFKSAILLFHLKWLRSAERNLADVVGLADGRKTNHEIEEFHKMVI